MSRREILVETEKHGDVIQSFRLTSAERKKEGILFICYWWKFQEMVNEPDKAQDQVVDTDQEVES